MITYAVVLNSKIVEIIQSKKALDFQKGRPGTRHVDITAQPWLKVGDYWGPDETQWVHDPNAMKEPASG